MSFEVGLGLIVAMLLGNAFFVGAEFGLVSARRSNIELKALNGSWAARTTLSAMDQVSVMLAGAQLGVTLCSLVLGAVGEPAIAHVLEAPFHTAGLNDFWREAMSFAIALALVVYLHVVVGEMVPKNLALTKPTRAALYLVPPLYLLVRLTRPVIMLLNGVANATLRLIGIKPSQEVTSSFSRDEVAGFVKESHHEGLLSKEEEQLLSGSLDFGRQTVASIILPRGSVVSASSEPTAKEVEVLAVKTGFSRIPIPNATGGLRGYVHLKDLLQIPDSDISRPVPGRLIRPLADIKISATLREALGVMQRSGSHIAQVSDEKSGLLGIVMLEDVMEELVGVIRDETRKS